MTYLRLIDKNNWVSPILHIHHDSEEFLKEVYKWREGLWKWVAEEPHRDGMPLGRLEAGICMIDLLANLHTYYIKTTPKCGGKVWATLQLIDTPKRKEHRGKDIEDTEEVIEIKTYKE